MRKYLSKKDIEGMAALANASYADDYAYFMLQLLIEWLDRSKDDYNNDWLDGFRPRVRDLLKQCGVKLP